MKQIISHIKDVVTGKAPVGSKRSTHWPTVRKEHLAKCPTCAVCGSKDNLEVHHKQPFHLNPALELDPNNLITLCESKDIGGLNCHLIFGHLGSFKSFNKNVEEDAAAWNDKFKNKP